MFNIATHGFEIEYNDETLFRWNFLMRNPKEGGNIDVVEVVNCTELINELYEED